MQITAGWHYTNSFVSTKEHFVVIPTAQENSAKLPNETDTWDWWGRDSVLYITIVCSRPQYSHLAGKSDLGNVCFTMTPRRPFTPPTAWHTFVSCLLLKPLRWASARFLNASPRLLGWAQPPCGQSCPQLGAAASPKSKTDTPPFPTEDHGRRLRSAHPHPCCYTPSCNAMTSLEPFGLCHADPGEKPHCSNYPLQHPSVGLPREAERCNLPIAGAQPLVCHSQKENHVIICFLLTLQGLKRLIRAEGHFIWSTVYTKSFTWFHKHCSVL